MGQRSRSLRVFALCVAIACLMLLTACGHDDGGQPGGSVRAAQWARTYGGGSTDVAKSVQPTADGGYIVAGSTSSFGAGDTDAWVLKLDASGSILWQKTYGGAGQDTASAVQPTTDGGYLVVGSTTSFGDLWPDAWVLKLDGSGNVLREGTYGSPYGEYAVSVEPTSGGGYLVVGSTTSFGAGGTDAWVLKLDVSGNIIRQLTYGGAGDDAAAAVQPTTDGSYVIAGYTASFGAGGGDAWVVKVDAIGAIPGCAVIASSGATSVAGSAMELDAATLVAPGNVSLVNHTAVSADSTAVASEQCRNE